jgi:hypothetical protein
MVLKKNLQALIDLFLNGACNEITVLVPYPECEIATLLTEELGWTEVSDSNGNPCFLPECRDDNFDFRSWVSLSSEDSEETTIQFGHM